MVDRVAGRGQGGVRRNHRLRALLLAALLAGGLALAAAVPYAVRLAPRLRGALGGGADGMEPSLETIGANDTVMAQLANGLASLAGRDEWPSAPPSSASEALHMAGATGSVPIPEARTGSQPLRRELAAYLTEAGYPVPAGLQDAVLRLQLAPEAESAVARLVAAFREARALEAEALGGLSDSELHLLALHTAAVGQWWADHPDATDDDFQAELAGLAARVDLAKSLEAASLMARTLEAVRPALSLPPGPAPPPGVAGADLDAWQTLQADVAAAFGATPAAPILPELPLADALRLLALAAGQPAPDPALVPPLPAAVADALSRLAVAHAYAMATRDPLVGGLAVLDAAQKAQPALEALAEWRRITALAAVPGALQPGSPQASQMQALQDSLAALGLPLLGPTASAQESPVPGGPEVPGPAANATNGTPPPPSPPPPPAGLPVDLRAFTQDSDLDGVRDGLEVLAGTDPKEPSSHPLGGTLLGGLPLGLPGDGPLLLVGRPLAAPSEPALLIVGDVANETVERAALLHVDLGGGDHYLVPVGTSTNLLLELDGDDDYDTATTDGTQGAATGFGAAVLLDLRGADRYRAGQRSQGSAWGGTDFAVGTGVTVDPNDPTANADDPGPAFWRAFDTVGTSARRQAGGLGLLADLGGNDSYAAGARSQGYGSNMAVTALGFGAPSRGFAGILFDAAGNDTYRFATQGFAEVTVDDNTGDWDGRPVGLFVDAAGNDTYDGRNLQDGGLMARNGTDTSATLFRSQGYARTVESLVAPSPVGAFLDLGGNDTYRIPALDGTVAPSAKNNRRLDPAIPAANGAPVRFFLDAEPSQAQAVLVEDGDGDHAGSLVELLAGTDPADPQDSPGRALGDPEAFAGDPSDGTLLRVPGVLREQVGGTLLLPGLAIGGRLDDTYSETFDFFLDLDGNDTYLAAGHGGAALPDIQTPRPLPAVRLAVDVAGNDAYRPQGGDVAGDPSAAHVRAYGSAPSLGGAHLGVSVMADLGGANTFQSSLKVFASHLAATGDTGNAGAIGWGATMGAGLFGGVGVLVTSDASNAFDARVDVGAEDNDNKPQATAAGYTVAQGAGFLGVGVLATLGAGRDDYRADADAHVPDSLYVAQARFAGVAQGAALSGLGLLADGGGDNTFDAPAGFAQGVGWALTLRTGASYNPGTVVDPEFSAPLEDGEETQQAIEAGVGVGLLVTGDGNDTYVADGPAQGAGGADLQLGIFHESKLDTLARSLVLHGGSGQGLLLDLGGDDSYSVPAASPGLQAVYGPSAPLVSQAAALAGSVGVLADLAGDDRYTTGPGAWSQGASVAGVAALLDLEGQDLYEAGDAAQGYAQAAVTAAVREHLCLIGVSYLVPCNIPVSSLLAGTDGLRGWQALAEALPQGATLGLLLDADGIDRYVADQESQGIATDRPDAPFRYAFCRDPAWGGLRQENFSACPPEQPVPNEPNAVGSENNKDFLETRPLGLPVHGPLFGLLFDADGTDQYDYADDHDGDAVRKEPLGEGTGPDDWAWRQEDVARRTASDANPPGGFFQGPLDPTGTNVNREPVANLTLSQSSAPAGTTIAFTLGAQDPDGSPVSARLDFGDDTSQQLVAAQGNPNGQIWQHTYAAPGNYRPALLVYEGNGNTQLSGSTSVPLAITGSGNQPPVASILSVSANTAPAFGQAGIAQVTIFTLKLDASDADGDAIVRTRVDWGDTQRTFGGGDPDGAELSHTYGTPGRFTATFHVLDARGAWGSASVGIVVRRTPADSAVPPKETLEALYNLTRDPPAVPDPVAGAEIPLPTFGGGIDASTMNQALRQLAATDAVPTVSLKAWRDEARTVPADGRATRTVYLEGTVANADGLVDRLDVTSDHGLVGRATPIPGKAGSYALAWATDAIADGTSAFPDGAYRLRAAAVLRAEGHAPGRTVESDEVPLRVDNVPILGLQADRSEFSARSAAPAPEPLGLILSVGPDSQRPAGVPGDGTPGGYLEVRVTAPGRDDIVLQPRAYRDAGPALLSWNGRCGTAPCPDGAYTIRATLEDAGGQLASASLPVRLDSTPPVTQVDLPRYLGTALSDGAERIRVPWAVSDPASLVGSPLVAGGPQHPCFVDQDGNGTFDRREPVYLAASSATAAGDVRLANPPAGSAPGSLVTPSSPDAGRACTPTPGGLAVRGGPAPGLVLDTDGSLNVTAGDVLLTGPGAGTVAAGGPADPLSAGAGAIAFLDAGRDRAFTAADTLHYDDPAGSGAGLGVASPGDAVLSGPRFGATVAAADVDNTDATVDLAVLDPTLGPQVVVADQGAVLTEAHYSPARHGTDLRFVTIGRDRLGNSESGCEASQDGKAVAACIQAFADAHPEKVRLTTLDFSPPEVGLVEASREHVRPGQPLRVNATVTESGTGLVAVRALFTGDDTPHDLDHVAGDAWTYAGWGDVNSGFDASERTVAVRVEAVDKALNTDGLSATFVLDDLPPRLAAQPVRYFAPGGKLDESSQLEVGRPDGVALIAVNVTDASLEDGMPGIGMQVDPSPLNATLGPVAMEFAALDQAWVAEVHIPADQADDVYNLTVRALDAAGNANLTVVPVRVDASKGRLGNASASSTFDSVTVAWDSARPSTTQVAWGRSAISLSQQTPLNATATREHAVNLTGLSPNTLYFVQGVSRSGNGVENRTEVLPIRTQSAIALRLEGLAAGGTYGGDLPLDVSVALRTGEDAAVRATLSAVPDNASLRPVPLQELGDVKGTVHATVNLRALPDGLWSLRVEASRPGDQATLDSAPFQVDNGAPFLIPLEPAPGAMVNRSRPSLLVAIGDPGAAVARDWAEGARLLVDGKEVPVEASPGPTGAAPGGTATLLLVPAAELADGEHRVEARVHDGAGNEAQVAWPFAVDTRAPKVASVLAAGPGGGPAAAPGGSIRVEARLDDAGAIAAAYIDGGWLAQPLALAERDGAWQADVPVPQRPDGAFRFRVQAFDRAGNRGTDDGAVTLSIDGTAPRLDSWVADPGLVGARLELTASEPVSAKALLDGKELAASEGPLSTAPVLDLSGLRPGRPVTVEVTIADAAGLESTSLLSFETRADLDAPGAPGALALASDEEGVVSLRWSPALDNAGIDHYEVATAAEPAEEDWSPLANGTATEAAFNATPGEALAVRLRAVDLGGLAGPAAEGAVDVLALPHVEDVAADPATVVKAGTRVTFEATYRHASGRAANLTLHLGDRDIPMEGGKGDCRTGCRYTARVTLEATDLFSGPPMFTVEANDGLHTATSEPQPAPLATEGGDGPGLTVPAVGPGVALLLFAFAAWRRRR